jgi:hypothetical protein
MTSEYDRFLKSVADTYIAGYLGYTAGSRKFVDWEPIITAYSGRISYLANARIPKPFNFTYSVAEAGYIYTEAVLAYLFGLPNASVPTTLRCLEVGLRNKYREIENEDPPDRFKLYDLVQWAQQYLRGRGEIAHGFRLLRNLIHGQLLVSEQDALEAIRHVSILLNILYEPSDTVAVLYSCNICGQGSQIAVPKQEFYLGNKLSTYCATCKAEKNLVVL